MIYLENNKINIWSPTQLGLLENRIAECVHTVKAEFKEYDENCRLYYSNFLLKDDVVANLKKTFQTSRLYYRDSGVAIDKQFDQTIEMLSACNSNEIMTIFYPVLFFSLIMKNEVKHNTVNSRIKRGTQNWGNTKSLFNIPSIPYNPRKESAEVINLRKELVKEKAKLLLHKGHHHKEAEDNLLEAIQIAEKLLDIEHITVIEEIAQIGLFLKDIFGVVWSKEQTKYDRMEILLQLYVVDTMGEIVRLCGELSNGTTLSDLEGKLLSMYFKRQKTFLKTSMDEEERHDIEVIEDLYHLGYEVEGCGEYTFLGAEEVFKVDDAISFEKLYESLLQAIDIHEWEINDILKFFFNQQRLSEYANYYDHVIDYVRKVVFWAKCNDINSISVTVPEQLRAAMEIGIIH